MSYDVIGDIHGQADKLEALLVTLGYRHARGAWRHPERSAVFVGDFIDRGPHQLRTLDVVRPMVEEGAALAVMGNHELNAIAWHTPHPEKGGEFLRPHHHPKWGHKNREQHARFLEEVEHDAARHRDLVDWFMTLPLWLDLPEIRVVHACWHQPFMDWLRPRLTPRHQLTAALLEPATREPEDETEKDNAVPTVFKAVEAITKGLEVPLPPSHSFADKDGIERARVRIRWWDPLATHYPQAAMLDSDTARLLPNEPIPAHARVAGENVKPVFFGHYWLSGRPSLQGPHAACVDYSAGKGGPLVAYRWGGETCLDSGHYVSAAR